MSNLSLFDIERGLHELMDAWQEAATPEAVAQAEQAIQAYAEAEVRKVDGIRAYLRACETQMQAAKAEMNAQAQRVRMWEARRDRLKAFVFETMQSFGVRKIEGATGSLSIRGNGGVEPLTITDPELIPDEFCTVTITLAADMWADDDMQTFFGGWHSDEYKVAPREPVNALIRAELAKPCEGCRGMRTRSTAVRENGDGEVTDYDEVPCPDCGGSGKRSVPGARLEPRGESLVMK